MQKFTSSSFVVFQADLRKKYSAQIKGGSLHNKKSKTLPTRIVFLKNGN